MDLPATISASVLNGELIDFYAVVSDDQGVQASAVNFVRIGNFEIDALFKDGFEEMN